MINPNKIKPKVKGKSDFFSWQLYRYARQHKGDFKVFLGDWNSFSGHEDNPKTIYVSSYNDEIGIHAKPIKNLCRIDATLREMCYTHAHNIGEWQDITDEWLEEYLKKGVCHIHDEGVVHKWVYDGDDKRTCKYCGEEQVMSIKMVEVKEWKQK